MAATTSNSIDDELSQFERDIRQLKIEYDQYFGGGRKRPPTEIEWRLEMVAKRYAERGGELKLLHLTKKVHDLLQITKLYTVFDVHSDENAALRSFDKNSV